MMFVIGPAASGKRSYVASLGIDFVDIGVLDVRDADLRGDADRPVEGACGGGVMLADECKRYECVDIGGIATAGEEELRMFAEDLACRYEVLIGTEVGCGFVPIDAHDRLLREARGRLHCLVAQQADVVVRLCCGIPQAIKGSLPHPRIDNTGGERPYGGDEITCM